MELFIHRRERDVELIQIPDDSTVGDMVNLLGAAESNAYLEGVPEPAQLSAPLAAAGITNRSNVYVGVCRKVDVSVRYQSETKQYEVPPSTTLQSVFDRAASDGEGFALSPADRAKYTLQVFGTSEQPDLSRHVGVFVNDSCMASFDLVLQDRFQG